MNVQVIAKVDGREVSEYQDEVSTRDAMDFAQWTEHLNDRLGQVVLEVGFYKCSQKLRHPCCCGQRMRNDGKRFVTVTSLFADLLKTSSFLPPDEPVLPKLIPT